MFNFQCQAYTNVEMWLKVAKTDPQHRHYRSQGQGVEVAVSVTSFRHNNHLQLYQLLHFRKFCLQPNLINHCVPHIVIHFLIFRPF